jgi:hypothetical protein
VLRPVIDEPARGPPAFERRLSELKDCATEVFEHDPSQGAAIALRFSDGSTLRADYWRLIEDGKARLSSFDHAQKYGLPAAVDAALELAKKLQDKLVLEACLDRQTGDLLFEFSDRIHLQVFNFTGYEVWEMSFREGTREFSNHVQPRERYRPDRAIPLFGT